MADFLLELLSEEIPARMQGKARADLEKLFAAELDTAGLKAENLETWSTPRRLVLIARGLPTETEAVREERKGPKADAPDQAVDGFLRSTGLSRDDLERLLCLEVGRGLFRGDRQAGPGDSRCSWRSDPGDHPCFPLAQIDALGRSLAEQRKPALGSAVAGDRCDPRRRSCAPHHGFRKSLCER